MDNGHCTLNLIEVLVDDRIVLAIPPGPIKIQTIDIYSVLWSGKFFPVSIDSPVFEVEGVDGDLVFPGVGLEDACEEALGEEEPAHPISIGILFIEPFGDEGNSVLHILVPRGQRFERAIAHFFPDGRHSVVEE